MWFEFKGTVRGGFVTITGSSYCYDRDMIRINTRRIIQKTEAEKEGQGESVYINTVYPVVLRRRGVFLSDKFVMSLSTLITLYAFYGEEEEDVGLRQWIMI